MVEEEEQGESELDGETEREKEGKGQWCCFLPSDLLHSSNHSDRRRAVSIEGKERLKGMEGAQMQDGAQMKLLAERRR